MATARYLFGDLASGDVIAEVPLTSVSMERQLNDWSVMRMTTRLDDSGMTNQDIVDATTPGKSFVVCELDDTPIWDGIVWTRVYDSLGKDMNLTARTYEAYAERNFVDVDLGWSQIEQRNIMIDLWNFLQQTSERNIGITTPSSYFDTVVPRDLTIMASEYKNFFDAMSSIADGDNGFDWTITTTRDANTGEYIRTLRIGYPVLGTTDAAGLAFDYPGQILNYWRTDGMSNAGTHLTVLGSGEGDAMIRAQSIQSDMITNGFKRYDLTISRKDISDPALATALAVQLGTQRRPPLSTIKVMLKGNLEPVFGSYGLGDSATLSIMDARHPEGLQITSRIVAWSYRPESDDSIEEAQLVFVGDDLNDE